tara:strand:- start:259 stop:528 length:270 start_codon:yes stop_codon:yes gene_type:complete
VELKRVNDNMIKGEIWELIPNTDFAYYSDHNRFCHSDKNVFPHTGGAYLCTEEELKKKINYMANIDNILNESEGYTNIDYYTQWRKTDG